MSYLITISLDFFWILLNVCALGFFAGTGYMTACFALMVGPHGRAVGVDHIPELVSFSIKNIEKSAAAPLLKDGSLSVHDAGMVFVFLWT